MSELWSIAIRAGVAPEVNLRNPLHVGKEAHRLGIHPVLKPRADSTRSPKQGVSVVP